MAVYFYFACILFTGVLCGLMALYAWQYRQVAGARFFAALLGCTSCLAVTEILVMLSPSAQQAFFFWKTRFLFLPFLSVFWLLLTYDYGEWHGWRSKRLLIGLFIIPVLTQVFLWSNNLHGLWVQHDVGWYRNGPFWIAKTSDRIPGAWFFVFLSYGVILWIIGFGLLLASAWRTRQIKLGKSLLLTGIAFALLFNTLIPVFNLLPHMQFNFFTPVDGAVFLLIGLMMFRFQFLTPPPAAQTKAADRMQAQDARSLAIFILIFSLMVTGILASGFLSYRDYASRFRAQIENNLTSIARLKVDEIKLWRQARMGDAEILYNNPVLSLWVQRYLENPDNTQARAELQNLFTQYYKSLKQYDRISLLDVRGVERISSPAVPGSSDTHPPKEIIAALRARQVTFQDFHRHEKSGAIYLSLLAPVYTQRDKRPLGVILLRIEPRMFFYPYLQLLPASQASAETLLIRREGTEILFLNELRFQSNTALKLRFPLKNNKLPAVAAALGHEGIMEGLDYRGVPVIADVRAVPDSPWRLVAKMDIAEVYAPLHQRLLLTTILLGALIMLCGAGLTLIFWRQRMRHYRQQAETAQALQESKESLQNIIQTANSVIIRWKLDGALTFVNDYCLNLFGYSRDELIGSHVNILVPAKDSLGTDLSNLVADITACPEKYTLNENENVTKSGERLWIAWSNKMLKDADGNVIEILAIGIDITERKKAENALREKERLLSMTQQIAHVGTWKVPLDVMQGQFSEEALFILGISPERRITSEQFLDLIHANDRPAMGKWIQDCLAGQHPPELEFRIVRPEGSVRYLAGRGDVCPASDGSAPCLIGSVQDITERKQAEEEVRKLNTELEKKIAERTNELHDSQLALLNLVDDLNQSVKDTEVVNRKLSEANKELESFSYSVSHDLRAPLRHIIGFSEILQNTAVNLDEKSRHSLTNIIDSAKRMGELIDDLLSFSRMGRAELRNAGINAEKLIRDVIKDLSEETQGRNIVWDIHPLPAVTGDAAMLRIVFINLIANAVKFTRLRERTRITIGNIPSDDKEIVFFVRDNGVGFDMKYVDKLFGVFQRLHSRRDFEGTGIGLANVKRIAERHGGKVWAEGAPDSGATFYVSLPKEGGKKNEQIAKDFTG
jgi:PAS domain S-box-containing protein